MLTKEKRRLKMIGEFQCPGCMRGINPDKCEAFEPYTERNQFNGSERFFCKSHVPGTAMLGFGKVFLGMPKGFNRLGLAEQLPFDLYLKEETPLWNEFNVPVWALKQDGFLFTRVYSPRVNQSRVEVWEDGTMPPNAIDVSKFYDEMD